jgi:DsbC/DsbD-like thiol-disulfide interchange protein
MSRIHTMPQPVLRFLLSFFLIASIALPMQVAAQFDLTPNSASANANTDAADPVVTATLVPEVLSAAPGDPFRIAVKLVHAKEWHTYGKVLPAEVIGKPTSLNWTLPEGWTIEELPWPATHEVPSTDGKSTQGYDGTVYLPARVTPQGKVGDQLDIQPHRKNRAGCRHAGDLWRAGKPSQHF